MAKRKIGLILALDGEKEMRTQVSACQKSIGALKSEMTLLKEESKGQANTLDTLQRKHETLSNILDEHKRKEEAVSNALEHAKTNYAHIGDEIDKYRKELEQAEQALEDMKNSGNASEEQIAQQEAAIQKLNDGLDEGVDLYDKAAISVSSWETKLNTAKSQTIKAAEALEKNDRYLTEAQQSADGCARSIDGYGKKVKEAEKVSISFGDAVKVHMVDRLLDAGEKIASEAFESAIGGINDLQEAEKKLQASTGATTEAMEAYSESLEELYKKGYGDSVADLAEQMATIKQNTNETDPTRLKELTEYAMAFSDTFNTDVSESIRGATGLVQNMGVTYETAFDLMAKGAQQGLNKTDELADNIAEYSQLWGQAGFSAQEMFAILDNGLTSGAYNLDKVNDFVKEFGISLADERFEQSLSSFSKETQNLFYQWDSGNATIKDVFYSVINDLSTMTNQQEALTLASTIWSSLGEDNALKVIASLNNVNLKYNDVAGTMESIKEIRYDGVVDDYKQLGRTLQTDVIIPIAEKFLPLASDIANVLSENIELVSTFAGVAAGAFAVSKVSDFAKGLGDISKGAGTAIDTIKTIGSAITEKKAATALDTAATVANTAAQEGSAAAHSGLFSILAAHPYLAVAAGVTALTVAVVGLIKKEQEEARAQEELYVKATNLSDKMDELTSSMQETTKNYEDNIAALEDQASASSVLVDELYDLGEQSEKSSDDIRRMNIIAAELNETYPDLSLSIDGVTGAISKNREETEKSIEASLDYAKAQAAQEEMTELAKSMAEADMERASASENLKEIEDELSAIEDERAAIMEKMNENTYAAYDVMVEYNDTAMTSRQALEELSEREKILIEAREEQNAGLEELNAQYDTATEKWTQAQEYVDNLTQATEENSEVVEESANTYDTWSQELQEQAGVIANAYLDMQESLSDTISSQMDMFEEFDSSIDLSTEQLLKNMESQIEGVKNWEANLTELADKGINDNLLGYLAEMGPEGAGYVSLFANMTTEELEAANAMWEESLELKDAANDEATAAMEAYATAIAGGTEKVTSTVRQTGYDTVQGMAEGIYQNISKAREAGEALGEAGVDGSNSGAGCASPSRKTMETGKNIVQGLINGMRSSKSAANKEASTIAKTVTDTFRNNLSTKNLSPIGKGMVTGLAQGMSSGKSAVITQASSIATDVKRNLSQSFTAASYSSYGKNVTSGIASGINSGRGSAVNAASTMSSRVRSAASSGSLYNAGYNLAAGMASGIRAGQSRAVNAAVSMANAAIRAARNTLGVRSPSTVFKEIGNYMAQGLAIGYEGEMDHVRQVINDSMYFEAGTVSSGVYAGSKTADVEKLIDDKIAAHGHDIYLGNKLVGYLYSEMDKRSSVKNMLYARS